MKAKFSVLVFCICSLYSINNSSQDFNLFNPSNELYLFSAYDEGANAFRYNPAVLGLGHKLNAALNLFIENFRSRLYLEETELMVNTGSLGLSFRSFVDRYNSSSSSVQQFSIGLGFGNKTISGGLLAEALMLNYEGPEESFVPAEKSKYKFTFGLLYRPAEFLSTAFTFKTGESPAPRYDAVNKYTLGLAVRPLKNDLVTLMADFSILPYYDMGLLKYNALKGGIDVKLLNGLYANANYSLINNPSEQNWVSFGLRFDFPNTSLRYNNPVTRIGVDNGRYNESYPFRSLGNHISLSYSLERRKSILPEKKKIVEITLSGSLQDYNTEDVFFGILGKGKRSIHEVIADIDYAAADPSVKGMLLKIYPLSTGRFEISAAIEELTNSLERFKAKNKSITAYFAQDAGPGEYYIATFADNIILPPEAIFFYGLSINVMNFKQFLEKYGIDLQTFHAGKYKLTFQGLLDSTTAEGKEVINRVLDIVYEKMMARVSVGRNIVLDDYMRDKLSQPLTGSEALRLGLVDRLGWYEDAKETAFKESKNTNLVRTFNRSEWDNEWSEPPRIAIIGVYGSITTGESQPPPPVSLPIPFVGGRSTGSESVVKQLEDAFSDPKIKAVVLRVDSGGGSALGSAEINAAVIRLKKKYRKPFIVSMGSAAASGGYYVSTSADRIFSDELTITGSIGVFTARPNLDSLLSGQKLKIENFKRGENSDIGTFYRKLDEREMEIIQGIIDHYYNSFISAISDGRKLTKEEAEQVAQGRVWMGSDAFSKKLVDEIGGLYEAIKYAKKKSKLGSRYKLVYYSVPGGNTINEIVTSSLIKYLQSNFTKLLGFDEDDDGMEIKY
jgi:protease-4